MAVDPRKGLAEARRQELLDTALELADVLRERVQKAIGEGLTIEAKPDRSLVTNADLEGEKAFREAVIARLPAHGTRGEELPPMNPDAEFVWIVDPVDGTAEFAAGLPLWGSMIGLYYRDRPLAGVIDLPALGLRARAAYGLGAWLNDTRLEVKPIAEDGITGSERIGTPSRVNYDRRGDHGKLFDRLVGAFPNIRVFHTCYTHVLAASGGLDAAIEWNAPLWDVGATRILIEEAGGKFTLVKKHEGDDGDPLYNVVFGRPKLVDRIVETFKTKG